METALYFPYIRVPQTPWFTKVLLYWDQAASIIPRAVMDDEDALDPYTKDLIRVGALRALGPQDEIWRVDYTAFEQTFLTLIESRPLQPAEKFSRVHIGKMSFGIFSRLQELGLAEPDKGPGFKSWWRVEVGAADLFMAYLAGAMSALTPGMLPVTDSAASMGTLAGTTGGLNQKLASLRYRVITEVLPAPSGPVSPGELISFKEANAEPLQRCRRFLDAKLADLAIIPDADLREVKTSALMQTIEDDVARLLEQMTKKKWPGVTLVGFGGVTGAGLSMANSIATGQSPFVQGLAVAIGSLAIGAQAYSTRELMKKPGFDQRAPLAYAALAGRLG